MELTKTQKTIIGFTGGFLIGVLLIWGWMNYSKRVVVEVPAETTTPSEMTAATSTTITNADVAELQASDSITVSNQPADVSVAIQSLSLAVDGWAVVHEESNGFIGNALGAARKDAGAYSNITVHLLRGTEIGKRYWVVLYADNGDRLFNLSDDFPLRDAAENVIMSPFTAN